MPNAEFDDLKAKYSRDYLEAVTEAVKDARMYSFLLDELDGDNLNAVSYEPKVSGTAGDKTADLVYQREVNRAKWEEAKAQAERFVDRATAAINWLGDDDYRRILNLRYVVGLQWPEVARALGLKTGTCRNKLHPALVALYPQVPTPYRMPQEKAL